MRDYNKTEPIEVSTARIMCTEPIGAMNLRYLGVMSSLKDCLSDSIMVPQHKREDAEDQLLYGFCETTHTHCAVTSDLLGYHGILPDATYHQTNLSLEHIRDRAVDLLEVMEDLQRQQQNESGFMVDLVNFGKWFYQNDQSISFSDLMMNSIQSVQRGMKTIEEIESMEMRGLPRSSQKFTEACQQFGQGKTMIESCLLPAAILKEDSFAVKILSDAKHHVIDPFVEGHQLESHLTKKGFLLGQTYGLDNKEKNYFAKAFESIKALTNRYGAKLYQEETAFGAKCKISRDIGKGKLTIMGNFTTGIRTQHNPDAPIAKQYAQKAISTIGSIASGLQTVETIARGNMPRLAKAVFDRITIEYDANRNIIGDERTGKPSSLANSIPKKPTVEPPVVENILPQQTQQFPPQVSMPNVVGNSEYLDVLVEVSKMALKNVEDGTLHVDIDRCIEVAEGLSSVGKTAIKIGLNGLDEVHINSFSTLSELIYEYQDLGKLPKVDVEVNKVASHFREHLKTVTQTVHQCYYEEKAKEEAWLQTRAGQGYSKGVDRMNSLLEDAKWEMEKSDSWEPTIGE